MLVFFRRVKNDPNVSKWKTAIHVIEADGSGLHALSDGSHTDFNQTWTRDGKNTPIWNRKNPETGRFYVMASKVGGKPGEEFALTDKRYHSWAYTCLTDAIRLEQQGVDAGLQVLAPGKRFTTWIEIRAGLVVA